VQLLADVLTSANSWNSKQPLLTYTVPPELQAEIRAGQLVAIPYGDRLVEGIVWKIWKSDGAEQQKTGRAARAPPQ
jgi:primosomal protein N' (replication factor Y)